MKTSLYAFLTLLQASACWTGFSFLSYELFQVNVLTLCSHTLTESRLLQLIPLDSLSYPVAMIAPCGSGTCLALVPAFRKLQCIEKRLVRGCWMWNSIHHFRSWLAQ